MCNAFVAFSAYELHVAVPVEIQSAFLFLSTAENEFEHNFPIPNITSFLCVGMSVCVRAWFVYNWWSLCWLCQFLFISPNASKVVCKMHFNDSSTYYGYGSRMSELTMRVNVCSFNHFSSCFFLCHSLLFWYKIIYHPFNWFCYRFWCCSPMLGCKWIALQHSKKLRFFLNKNPRYQCHCPIAVAKWKFW